MGILHVASLAIYNITALTWNHGLCVVWLNLVRCQEDKPHMHCVFCHLCIKLRCFVRTWFHRSSAKAFNRFSLTCAQTYLLFSYVHKHNDGRVSYPQVFIFFSPEGCDPKLQMRYSGCRNAVLSASGMTKVK